MNPLNIQSNPEMQGRAGQSHLADEELEARESMGAAKVTRLGGHRARSELANPGLFWFPCCLLTFSSLLTIKHYDRGKNFLSTLFIDE